MEIKWSDEAEASFNEIVDDISNKWTQREVDNFIEETDKVINNISQFPFMYAATNKRKNIRRAVIASLTSLIYRVKKRKEQIELILFWDNRKNPKQLKIK